LPEVLPLTVLPDVPLVPGVLPGAEDDDEVEPGVDEEVPVDVVSDVLLGELVLLGIDELPEAEPLTLPLVPDVVASVEAVPLGVVVPPGVVVTVVLLGVVVDVVLEVVPFVARLRSQPVAAAEARTTTATTGMRRFMKSPVRSCRCRKTCATL
jgi:hypothetical protein